MQFASPRIPVHSIPDTPEEAREHLAQLLRARPSIEEDLGFPEGCSDRQLIESLLKHDSPFALLRSLGFDSGTATSASCLLKESNLTPRVRDLARNIEVKLSPVRPPTMVVSPMRRKSDMADVPDSAFDWRKQVRDAKVAPSRERDDVPPPSQASGFHLGQSVRVAFTKDGVKMAGVVTCVEPLQVQPQGMSESFEFWHVETVDTNVDSAVQVVANESADKCAVDAPPVDTDLRALEMAKLCLEQGMPELAKVYMEKISFIDVKAGTIPTQMMASIVEEGGTAEKHEVATNVPVQEPAEVDSHQPEFEEPAEVDSHQPEFEPTALDTPRFIVNDEGALGRRGTKAISGCRVPESPEAFSLCCGTWPRPAVEPRFAVGQRVMFADHEADEWKKGVVTCMEPLLIRPDGYEESFDFNLVEPLDSAQPGGSETACVGVQDTSSGSCGGGDAERLNASEPPPASPSSVASSKGTVPLHGLGKAIDTYTSRVPRSPATRALQNTKAPDGAVVSASRGNATSSSWLPCCVSR